MSLTECTELTELDFKSLDKSRSVSFFSMNLNKPLSHFVFNGSSIIGRAKRKFSDCILSNYSPRTHSPTINRLSE